MSESLIDERFSLEDLLDLPTFREIIEAFASCFEVGILVVDEIGRELVRQVPAHQFCQKLRAELAHEARCEEVQEKILKHPITGTSAIQVQAFCGLKYAAFALFYQLNMIGRVVIGPYRDERKLQELPIKAQLPDINQALNSIPLIQASQLKRLTRLLAKTLDAFIFINAKRLVTTHMHLETIMQAREQIFEQIEKESTGTEEKRRDLDKLKQMF
jgi:ligand-binding sensor protein